MRNPVIKAVHERVCTETSEQRIKRVKKEKDDEEQEQQQNPR